MVEYWVIPPDANAEFVASMEEVLDVYERAYDPAHPVLCMDEQPIQLQKETRVPIAATREHGRRVDYEYKRHGTARLASSCSLSRFRVIGRRLLALDARKWTGLWKWLTCSTLDMSTVIR